MAGRCTFTKELTLLRVEETGFSHCTVLRVKK